ncbi:MAG: class I SAM-dependent methyltransferase [Candidatus Aenigmatarchaeota archaeon]
MNKTIDTYDELAGTFAERWFKRLLVGELKFFRSRLKGKNVLDIGCGPGQDCKWLTEHGCRAIGIDASVGMLKEARKRVKTARFVKMDMRKLRFPENSFDGLWVCASLLHIKKSQVKKVLTGFRKVLKHGGIMFIAVKAGSREKYESHKDLGKRFFSYYRKDELERLLRDSGFKIIKSHITRDKKFKKIRWINLHARKI